MVEILLGRVEEPVLVMVLLVEDGDGGEKGVMGNSW